MEQPFSTRLTPLRVWDVTSTIFNTFDGAFRVVSKNSPSLPVFGDPPQPFPYSNLNSRRSATQYQNSGIFEVFFANRTETTNGQDPKPIYTIQTILQQPNKFSLLPCSNALTQVKPGIASLVSPFFYQDDRHTFLVEPSLTETTIVEWEGWVIGVSTPDKVRHLDDWVNQVEIQPNLPKKPILIDTGVSWLDPSARFNLRQTDWVTNPTTVLQYGDRPIGQTGGLNSVELPNLNGNRGLI